MELARRTLNWKPSPTMALNARAAEKAASGVDVVNFTVGEPDMEPPASVREEAARDVMSGSSKYTPALGMPDLRRAIAAKFLRDQGLPYSPKQVGASVGGKHALYNVFHALLNPGDEAIIPSPYWVTYPDQVLLAEGVPVIVPCLAGDGFKLTPKVLSQAISERTRVLVLNSPNNPTGAVYSEEELRSLVDVALAHGLTIISDEVYEALTYSGAHHVSPASLSRAAFEATVIVHSVSKTYAMTGWRIGFVASASEDLVRAIGALQSQVTSNPATIAQRAAIRALELTADEVQPLVETFARRRELIVGLVEAIPALTLVPPKGAFYIFPDVSRLRGREIAGRTIRDGDDVATLLLDAANVAVVPGSSFGAPEHIRISFATSDERIREGMSRIREVLA